MRDDLADPTERSEGTHMSKSKDYTASFTGDQTPEKVFNGINNVRGWWSENIEGSTDMLGAEFSYRYQDAHFCKIIKLTELVPGKRIAWHVLDNRFNFTKDKNE
jgi:hypothetical protein